MKNCPFCKKSIIVASDVCPHCGRVLIERIYSGLERRPQPINQERKPPIGEQSKKYFEQSKSKLRNFNWGGFKKYFPVLIVPLLLIVFVSTRQENRALRPAYNSHPISVIPNNRSSSITSGNSLFIPIKDPKSYVSLPNGTVLSKDTYSLAGLGELEVDNGTSLDAIAKLVDTTTKTSIFTVYIKANSIFTINKVSSGNYKLYFNLGNDWDSGVKAFRVNSGYEVFEEDFDFTTSKSVESEGIRTRYATFRVTLNPTIDGRAETNEVDAGEFGSY